MSKTYRVTTILRFVNRMMRLMIRLNIAPKGYHLLTVQGRKSGKLYSTPVALVEEGDQRWLVSPYGEVAWLRNTRAAGQVTLSRGGKSETVKLVEQGSEASAPVLKQYLAREGIVQPYFDVQPDSPIEAFVAEAPRHPVFLIRRPS
jgi:deazaflavin-dependent oxidoreductase (nitroreductase family)